MNLPESVMSESLDEIVRRSVICLEQERLHVADCAQAALNTPPLKLRSLTGCRLSTNSKNTARASITWNASHQGRLAARR